MATADAIRALIEQNAKLTAAVEANQTAIIAAMAASSTTTTPPPPPAPKRQIDHLTFLENNVTNHLHTGVDKVYIPLNVHSVIRHTLGSAFCGRMTSIARR